MRIPLKFWKKFKIFALWSIIYGLIFNNHSLNLRCFVRFLFIFTNFWQIFKFLTNFEIFDKYWNFWQILKFSTNFIIKKLWNYGQIVFFYFENCSQNVKHFTPASVKKFHDWTKKSKKVKATKINFFCVEKYFKIFI